MTTCRVLPFENGNGHRNMAADESLLESAVLGQASFRLYGWSEATLSLGYFQPEKTKYENPRIAALPFVRRPTGGGALVHHYELTYALALPGDSHWHEKSNPWLCRMHAVISAALASLDVNTNSVSCKTESTSRQFLCFQHVTAGDLVIEPSKVTGSAQRRVKGALLQHGAVLLAASPHAPELPGILEMTGRSIDSDLLRAVILRELARETGWELTPSDWTAAEIARVDRLVDEKYRQSAWNQKR